jgi:hypothetical protein
VVAVVAVLAVLLLAGHGKPAIRGFGPRLVGGGTNSSANADHLSVTLSVKAGATLVGSFRAAATPSVSDSVDAHWRQVATDAGKGGVQSLWYLIAAKGGSTTVTLTGSTGPMRMVVDEYTGVSSLDTAGCHHGTSSTVTTPTLSAASSGEFAYAGLGMYDQATVTALGPARLRTLLDNGTGVGAGADVLSVTHANVSLGFTLSATPPGGWDACLALFRPAGGTWGSLTFGRAFASSAAGGSGSSPNRPIPAWHSAYGSCRRISRGDQIEFNITASSGCDPGADGHYRSDIMSPGGAGFTSGVYPAGQARCTTVSVDFLNGSPPPIPPNSSKADWTWLVFAEMEDPYNTNQHDLGGWGMGIQSWWTNFTHNQWEISVVGPKADGSARSTWDGGVVAAGWHSFSICTNDASSGDPSHGTDGRVYSIWFDGVREQFNHGPCAGSYQCNGFPLIQDDPTNEGPHANWPLIIDDYTGGRSAVPNSLVEGVPLVATIGSNGRPPEPPDGWNSP